MMKNSLRDTIINTISISEEDLDFMLSFFNPTKLEKGEYFLEIGKRCDQIAFINNGLLRIFYPNDKGEETTCYFSLPTEFVTSFSSFTTQKPSTENIQAILPSELFVINKQDLELLYKKFLPLRNSEDWQRKIWLWQVA